MVLSTTKKQDKSGVTASEAFNLWNMLRAKYMFIERMQIWDSLTHDKDLKFLLKGFRNKTGEEVALLEKEMVRYSTKGPNTNRSGVKVTVNTQVITDQYMAEELLLVTQEHLEMLLRAIRTTVTNDRVRSLFTKFATVSLDVLDLTIKYVKLKGWTETPPLYPLIPQDVEDKLDTSEAFLLWDHLTYRYDNMKTTSIFQSTSNDGDFKLILKQGREQLARQAGMLEKELLHFGIPLPVHPPAVTPPTKTLELVEDDHLYRTLLMGMQGAGILHANAIKQSTTNDRVRSLFQKLLLDEIYMQERIIKFGKLKGWLNPSPEYSAMLT